MLNTLQRKKYSIQISQSLNEYGLRIKLDNYIMQHLPKKPTLVTDRTSKNATAMTLLHPRNRYQGQYDFIRLATADSMYEETSLAQFIQTNPHGELSIDFTNPQAVIALNRALLKDAYQITDWNIPATNLCPPVPGRADYVHYLADLLATNNQGKIPRKNVRILDIGTGANGIYPLIGASEYDWQFVASDINVMSLENFQKILDANRQLKGNITLRLQPHSNSIFDGIISDDEWFDLSMCNPPFHQSLAEAQEGTRRKWKNLGRTEAQKETALNFGGQDAELWCPGGELSFIQSMIKESQSFSKRCFWFTSLVSKSTNLPALTASLKHAKVHSYKTIQMQQGNKQSRFIAWTFLTPSQQIAWAKLRWR